MDQTDPPLPPGLRALKWLVIVLTLTMILGVITVVTLLVIRMPQAFSAVPGRLPETITLPPGTEAQAVTFGRGWIGVVATGQDGDRFLLYAPDGRLRQEIALSP